MIKKLFFLVFIIACKDSTDKIKDVRKFDNAEPDTTQCRKCATKNNWYPCRFCKCKNHNNIDLENNECELLGFCEKCDKFCCMNCTGDPNYHDLFNT